MFSKPRLQNSSPILAFWCCNQAKWKTEETHFGWLLSCQIRLFLLLSYTNTKLRGRSGEQGEKYGCVWEERKDGFRILNESNKLKTCLTISETKVSRKRSSITLYIQFFKRLFFGIEPSFQKESYEESQIYKTGRIFLVNIALVQIYRIYSNSMKKQACFDECQKLKLGD